MSDFRRAASAALATTMLIALSKGSSIAYAQARTFDADGAVAEALSHNPTLRSAVLERDRALRLIVGEEARYGFVFGADATANVGNSPTLTRGGVVTSYNEQVSLGTQLSRTFGFGTSVALRAEGGRLFRNAVFIPTMPMTLTVGPGYSFDVTLSLTQPILRGFGENVGLAQLRSARIDSDRTTAVRDRTASQLVRDVTVAYWELWYAEHALSVQRGDRDLAAAQAREARERQELGALAGADVLSFSTRLSTAEEAVAAAEVDVAQRRLEMARLLGDSQLQAASLSVADDPPPTPAPGGEDAIERALQSSIEIAELEAQVKAAEESARIAGAALEPRLDVEGQIGVHGMGYDDATQAFAQWGSFTAVTGLVSLTFELPLDDTQHRMELERASIAIESATQQLQAAKQNLEAQVRVVLATQEAARRRLALAEETIELAGQLARAEEERFNLGSRTAISVVEAQNSLRDAQLRALRARVDLVSAGARLSHYAGNLLDGVVLE